MFKYIIAALIGILLYQILVTIVYAATRKENSALTVAIFVPFCIFRGICDGIITPIYLNWCKKNLKKYRFCFKDAEGRTHSSIHTWYATDKAITNFTFDESKDYFIKKISDGQSIKEIPYKNEIYKGQKVFKGFDVNLFEKR